MDSVKPWMTTWTPRKMRYLCLVLLNKTHRLLALLLPPKRVLSRHFHLQKLISPHSMKIILKLWWLLATKRRRSEVPLCKNLPMKPPPFSTTLPQLWSSRIRWGSLRTPSLFLWRTSIVLHILALTTLEILRSSCHPKNRRQRRGLLKMNSSNQIISPPSISDSWTLLGACTFCAKMILKWRSVR